MGSLSTFGTFTMARLGIMVSQHALNTTGNNISNINTEGYTRQKIDQTSMYYGSADRYQSRFDLRSNGGVLATGIEQLRDQYLDIRYRNEMTRVGTMEEKLDGLQQLSVIFDEVNKGDDGEGVLEARFNDLAQQLETMLQDYNVGRNTNDSIVREAAEALAIQFNDYAKQLETLTDNMTADFKQDLTETNTILTKIRDLNEAIRRSQVFGGGAMTQKDERNLLIDELAKKIGINVIYETEDLGDGVEVEKLRITTSGDPARTLVDGIYSTQLSLAQTVDDVVKTDDQGNPMMNSRGEKIVEKTIGDHKNFDLIFSELTDARGKVDPSSPNKPMERVFEVQNVGRVGDKTAAGYKQGEEWESVKGKVETLTFDISDPTKRQKAVQDYEDALNAQFGYVAGTVPYFHIGQSEFMDDQNQVLAGYENTYVVHFHDYEGTGTAGDTYIDKWSYVNVKDINGTRIGDTELTGGLQAQREMLTESGEYTKADKDETKNNEPLHYDAEAGVKRGIPYYRQALDTLARTFAEKMNEANTLTDDIVYQADVGGNFIGIDGATYTLNTETGLYSRTPAGGKASYTRDEIKAYFAPKKDFEKYFDATRYTRDTTSNKFKDKDGNELDFTAAGLKETDFADKNEVTVYTKNDEYKDYFGGNLFSISGTSDKDGTNGDEPGTEKITAANISISHAWSHGSLHVLRSISPDAPEKSRLSDNLAHIVTMLTTKYDFSYGEASQGTTSFNGTFQEMLTDTIAGTLAKDGNITNTMLKNYNATADSLYVDRDAVMGVDLNDEAMNMMQFQKAYSAACRLMTTYDEMLEKLVNGTAV